MHVSPAAFFTVSKLLLLRNRTNERGWLTGERENERVRRTGSQKVGWLALNVYVHRQRGRGERESERRSSKHVVYVIVAVYSLWLLLLAFLFLESDLTSGKKLRESQSEEKSAEKKGSRLDLRSLQRWHYVTHSQIERH